MKLRDGEVVLHELRPEKAAPVVWFFANLKSEFPLWMAFALMAGILVDDLGIIAILALAASGIAFLLLLSFAYAFMLCRTFRYLITTERCMFMGGIIRYRERSVGYHKITDVERGQNLIERALGLCSVRLFTPGTGGAEIEFIALKDGDTPIETIHNHIKKAGASE